ncbi:MAG: MATE family efflux transporter [Clostridia bacterium]|nr:MATE family efflux transporter [Clostridia bacterium]
MVVKSRNIDMCSGPLFKNVMKFAVPFMLTLMLQHLYNAADIMVVGRYAGQEALAGVGTTGSLTSVLINLFVGLSVGVSVTLGRALGAKDEENANKIVHTAITLSVICGVFISVIGIVFAERLLKLIDVPDNVMPQAKLYMKIVFAGKMPSLLYNFGSAILRAKGDTKRPLYIVTISGVVNVLLNLFFVIKLEMQADGVALATVISQVITAVWVMMLLCRETDVTKISIKKLKIHKNQLKDILKMGIPSGIQSTVFSLSNTLVQSTVNGFGSAAIAGSTASNNVGNFYGSSMEGFAQAALAFTSQNVGAKKYKRINRIIGCCIMGVAIASVATVLITVFAGERLISFYAPGDFEAIKYGTARLMIVGSTYFFLGLMNVMSRTLWGLGKSVTAMLISMFGVCGIRIMWIYTVFQRFSSWQVLFISYPASWLGTFILHFIFYLFAKKQLNSKPDMLDL